MERTIEDQWWEMGEMVTVDRGMQKERGVCACVCVICCSLVMIDFLFLKYLGLKVFQIYNVLKFGGFA